MSESPNEIFFCSGSLNVGRIFIFARGLFVPNWPNGSHNQKIIFCSVPRRNTIDVASNQRLHINTWIFGMTTQSYVGFRGFCEQFHFVGHCLFHLYNITNSQIGLSSWPASGEKMLWPQFLLVINRTNHACTGWAITSRTSSWEFGRKGRAAGARWTKRPNQLTERSTQVRKVRVHPVVGKQARGQSKTNLVNNNGPRHSPINHGPPYISHTSELPQDTTSSWRLRRSCPFCRWSWCADLARGRPNNDGDRDARGSSSDARDPLGACCPRNWPSPDQSCLKMWNS